MGIGFEKQESRGGLGTLERTPRLDLDQVFDEAHEASREPRAARRHGRFDDVDERLGVGEFAGLGDKGVFGRGVARGKLHQTTACATGTVGLGLRPKVHRKLVNPSS